MTKVTDAYSKSDDAIVVIADCTPPRSGDPAMLDRLKVLDVEFVCVAYNPGKLVRADSVVAAYTIKERVGKDVVFNLATRDMNKIALGSRLLGAQMLGLENVVIVQGDEFTQQELGQVSAVNDFSTTGLLRSLRSMNEGLDYRGSKLRAPTSFCLGATLDLARDVEEEALLTYRKSQSGAEYFITQPIYDLDRREQFFELYETVAQAPLSQPVFWGLQVLDKDGVLLGDVPAATLTDLEKGRPGTDIALELLHRFVDAGVRGIYLVPPILRGGARDYEAAQQVIRSFKQ